MTPDMSIGVFIAISLAGGLGAVCRLILDGVIKARHSSALPLGTIAINLTGSIALGLLAGLATTGLVNEAVHLAVGTGFLGGYTTFSTASFETVRLLQESRRTAAAVNGLGQVMLATALAGIGMWIGATMGS